MNTLDFFLIIPIAIGFIFGLFKGLIKELISLVAIVLGVYGAKLFSPVFSAFLIRTFDFSTKTALPLSYLFLFLVIVMGLMFLSSALDKLFDTLSLGGLNQLLGGLFGGLKFALIVSVLLNVFDALDGRFPIINQGTKTKSIGYKPMLKFGPALWEEVKSTNTKISTTDYLNDFKKYD